MASNSTTPIVPYSLDDYFQSTPIGSVDKAIGNNLYGINHRQLPGMVPSNKDTYGYTFFVRPQLNLQADNLRNKRIMYPLLTESDTTIQRFVRCTLDPRLIAGYRFRSATIPPISCSIMDNNNAFIPVLTNNLISLSGWPDVAISPYTSKPGLYKQVYTQIDDIVTNYESFDIEATFKNSRGDPILYMFYIWLHYGSSVFIGDMMPYIDFISENEIDYNTRIYRLVLDQNKEVVKKIAATGVSIPISVPLGSFFDYNNEKPYNDQNKEISIRFRCTGATYQDDILIKEFNQTVAIFNPSMADNNREQYLVKVTKNLIHMFNFRGYPRINQSTNELEWWVDKQQYNARTQSFIKNNLATPETLEQDYGD
jgi:hypothetical protein